MGTITTNFLIPDYLGLGKQTARGFGTVVRIRNGTEQPSSRRTVYDSDMKHRDNMGYEKPI
jgi:hypothetical protein